MKDNNPERPDKEGHGRAIIAVENKDDDDVKGPSYLGWYQAIVLADQGAAEESRQMALETRSYDANLKKYAAVAAQISRATPGIDHAHK